ncbi:hypothetical protein ACFQ0C_17810 [Paenibacillus sp. GCM10027630]
MLRTAAKLLVSELNDTISLIHYGITGTSDQHEAVAEQAVCGRPYASVND